MHAKKHMETTFATFLGSKFASMRQSQSGRLIGVPNDLQSVCDVETHWPQEIADKIQPYIDLGFHELVFHFPGNDQRRYIDEFASDVFPLLRK